MSCSSGIGPTSASAPHTRGPEPLTGPTIGRVDDLDELQLPVGQPTTQPRPSFSRRRPPLAGGYRAEAEPPPQPRATTRNVAVESASSTRRPSRAAHPVAHASLAESQPYRKNATSRRRAACRQGPGDSESDDLSDVDDMVMVPPAPSRKRRARPCSTGTTMRSPGRSSAASIGRRSTRCRAPRQSDAARMDSLCASTTKRSPRNRRARPSTSGRRLQVVDRLREFAPHPLTDRDEGHLDDLGGTWRPLSQARLDLGRREGTADRRRQSPHGYHRVGPRPTTRPEHRHKDLHCSDATTESVEERGDRRIDERNRGGLHPCVQRRGQQYRHAVGPPIGNPRRTPGWASQDTKTPQRGDVHAPHSPGRLRCSQSRHSTRQVSSRALP